MKFLKALSLLPFLIIPTNVSTQYQSKTTIENLNWLTGNWEYTSSRSKTLIAEHWTEPAGMMLGIGRTINDEKVKAFEYLRIVEKNSEIFYIAKPSSAKNETAFKLTKLEKGEATFENPQHNFPKKIVYKKLSKNKILVRVSGGEGKGFSYEMIKK